MSKSKTSFRFGIQKPTEIENGPMIGNLSWSPWHEATFPAGSYKIVIASSTDSSTMIYRYVVRF